MITRASILTPTVVAALREHAVQSYPSECCGVVRAGAYVPEENVASNPSIMAQIAGDRLLDHHASGDLQAICHSHADGPDCPSAQDMRAQITHAVPAVLIATNGKACLSPMIWGDQLEMLPLEGRQFRHAITDCYEVIRDYFLVQGGERLMQFPRDWDWWLGGKKNLYEENFSVAGFEPIDRREAGVGDVVLFRVGGHGVSNHAGVIVEPGVMLHHPCATRRPYDAERKSKKEPINRWLEYTYEGGWLRKMA